MTDSFLCHVIFPENNGDYGSADHGDPLPAAQGLADRGRLSSIGVISQRIPEEVLL